MMYRKALPRVWSSSSNSNEAAVELLPGSCFQSLTGSDDNFEDVPFHAPKRVRAKDLRFVFCCVWYPGD